MRPSSARTLTLQEAPSFAWRTNARFQPLPEAGARELDRDKARCTMHVSSSPPLSTGRAACTAPGSAPVILLPGGTLKRRFPLRQCHRCPPVDSVRVPWRPLLPSSHRRGAFAIRPHPGVPSFPGFGLLGPLRLSSLASRLREAFPPHSFPTALRIHRGVSRVPHGRRPRHDGGGVLLSLPRLRFAAPQALHRGEDRLTSVTTAISPRGCCGPSSHRADGMSSAPG